MDEMAMVKELGRQLEHQPPATLSRQRNRLDEVLRGSRRKSRRLRRVVVVAGLAVVTSTSVALVQTMRVGDQSPPSTAAADVLNKAADAASQEAGPRPGQFEFIHYKEAQGNEKIEGMDWISVDGSKVGLSRRNPPLSEAGPGWGQEWACEEGNHPVKDLRHPPRCKVLDDYRDDLPTDPDRMLAYLYQEGSSTSGAWEQASDLLAASMAPKSRAALFRAMVRIPGVKVDSNATDAVGRHGVGVVLTVQGERSELIFDRETYTFLGSQSVQLKPLEDAPAGQVTYYVVLQTGYVDKLGEFPR